MIPRDRNARAMRVTRTTHVLTAIALLASAAHAARAQNAPSDTAHHSVPADSSTASPRRERVPWVTSADALAFGAAAAGTVLLAPLDHSISAEFVEPGWKRRRRLHHLAGDVAFFGGDGPFVASAVILAGTSVGGPFALRRFAIHNMESIALATIITGLGKGISGRALPGVRTRHAFELGRGFHDANGPFVSFPSGHTAAAFAMATTIAGEWKSADSSHARLVDILSFGGATAVGVARVVQRMHWPSDLPMAAFIGTWSGLTVQRHAGGGGVVGNILRGLTVGIGPNGRTQFGWSSLAPGDRIP